MPQPTEKIIVTSALPYANGPIHFGHITGAYLPADIFVRYKRMRGAEVIYICGSDDHGVPITITAEARGVSPEQHVAENHALIKSIFDRMNIGFSNFSQTSRKDPHYAISQEFYIRLSEAAKVEKRTEKQYFCEACARFLPDRYITGTCPYCGHEGARGDECGGCGRSLEPEQLKDPKCKVSGHTPTLRATANWYLRLGDFENWLAHWLESRTGWRQLVLNEARKYLAEGLHTRPITRDLSWGIPVPGGDPDAEGKVLYVWFDAPIGYISSTIEYFRNIGQPERWKEFWQPEDPESVKMYNFIGKDNIFFHAIMFPIMCYGVKQNYKLTDNVVSNAFLNLEGKQFSKSEGWYIDPLDFLDRYPVDSARFYLCGIMPENVDAEFRWDDFGARHNELANVYGNIVHRVISFTCANFGEIPAMGECSEADNNLLAELGKSIENCGKFLDEFSFRRALESMMDIARAGHKYLDSSEPWNVIKSDKARAGTILRLCLRLVKALAVVSYPFLPDTATAIWKMLGLEKDGTPKLKEVSWDSALEDTLETGLELPKPEILFTRLEKKQIEEEKKKLSGFTKRQQEKKGKLESVRPPRPITDFQKWDLRAGRVIAAEPVPKSNKMLKLTVDIGVETRTVVAGIAQAYKPEDLTGRTVVIVANLEPKALMGIESQGMILAAGEGKDIKILEPAGDVAPGTRVS